MEKNTYYVGLDMGTSSVGWAVTDKNYVLERAKGKDMWGVRLFSEADTAEKRRMARGSRRRRQRQVARINYLNMCFAPEIEKVDQGFLMRLRESKYHLEDRSEGNKQKNSIFNDKDFTDKEYFDKYPTIFHLRSELLEDDPIVSHDIRLVYLAILNIYKHRGHFLNNNLTLDSKEVSFVDAYNTLYETASYFEISFPESIDITALKKVLSSREISKKEKLEELINITGISKRNDVSAYELLKLISGTKGCISKIFEDSVDNDNDISLSFSEDDFEEQAVKIAGIIGDERLELIIAAKEIYDTGILSSIIKGDDKEKYLSNARVDEYNCHHEDLLMLKKFLKKYDKDAYHFFFKDMADGNYSAYIGSTKSNRKRVKCVDIKNKSQEELFKTIKKIINALPEDAKNDSMAKTILSRIELGNYLNKQLTGANGVIPYQIHGRELKKILENASTYLPFLNDKDESGLTTAERILEMFTFKIPYFVGPLGQEHVGEKGYNTWAKRIAPGKIYPWNIEEKIDMEQAAEDFIVRMLRNCTYLQDQKALPKQSLLYEKFMVLNELNNLKIYGEKITVDQKQDIYNALFMKGKKVIRKHLVNYLIANGLISKNDSPDVVISGIDGDFKSSLSSMNKFAPIFGPKNVYGKNRDMIEKIIFWGTVFGKDKNTKRKKIKAEYGDLLNDELIERIVGLSFTGWGNLSKELLEMPGKRGSSEEDKSIIISMWEHNENLMELLGGGHTFKEELENKASSAQKDLYEWDIEDLDGMYLSPSVKRMVWQTLRIIKDICSVKRAAPERIFVEMPRGEGEKGKRTQSRKKKLEDLYKKQGDILAEIKNHDERDFKQKKLYLYYLQNGMSMYSGNPIDLENLLSNNSEYDIDHIYPRHYVKDDSLDDNLVLAEKVINSKVKGEKYPVNADIQAKMEPLWREFLREGRITKEKYDRLTRKTEFTEQEQADFISRQLVETRQGTKAITQILKQALPETKIVFSKASNVSSFRQKFVIPKVRSLNSCHHAHDAYLNIVVGNTYYVKFTSNPLNFIKEAGKHWEDPFYKYHMDRIFDSVIERNGETAWIPQKGKKLGSIKTVMAMIYKTSMIMTYMPYLQKGKIADLNPDSSSKATKNPTAYWPLKTSDSRLFNVASYGGYSSISNAAFALVQYTQKGKSEDKNKVIRALIGIPILLGSIDVDNALVYEYLKDRIQREGDAIEDFSIRLAPIRLRSIIEIDGVRYCIGGATGNQIGLYLFMPPYLCLESQAYIKKIEKALETDDYSEQKDGELVITKEKNGQLYEELMNKIINSAYQKVKNSIGRIIFDGKCEFESLSVETQCYVLLQITLWLSGTKASVNLSALKQSGGSSNSGKTRISNKISSLSSIYLINMSPTGLFEKKVDLLKV